MFCKLLTAFMLMTWLSASAQLQLTGRVSDDTANPVAYATILLLTSDSVFVMNDLTNTDGRFSLMAKSGDYLLKISLLGKLLYRQSLHLASNTDLGKLKVNITNELGIVTVAGQKPVIQQDMDKLIFNVENSPLKKGYNGLDVLARTPRLQVNSGGAVVLRNKTPDLYINGRKLNLSGQDLASYLSSINAEMIKNIEIQTMGSAETDASANGGVVNINLKKPAKGFTSNLTTSYTYRKGNYWSDYAGINNNYGSDKWNFYSKLSYSKDNDFGTYTTTKHFFAGNGLNVADGSFTGNKRSINLLGGMVFYPGKKNEFGAEVYYNNAKGLYTTPEQLMVYDPGLVSASNNNRIEDFKNTVWYATANHTYKLDEFGSMLKFIGDIGRNRNRSDNSTDVDYTLGDQPSSLTRYDINPLSDYYTLQGDLTKKYRKAGWQLRTGLKFSSVNRDNKLRTTVVPYDSVVIASGQQNFTNRENIVAGYATLSGKLNAKNSFRVGLRTEYTNLDGEDKISWQNVTQHYIGFFPRFYYGYALAKDKTLSLAYSRSIQRPSFRDLNPFITKENDYSYITGNPNLKPQYTNSFDLSFQLSKQSISLHVNMTNDLIAGVYSNEGNVTYYRPQNFGKQRQYGLDYNYYGDVTKWLYANVTAGMYYYTFDQGGLHPDQFSFNSNIYSRVKIAKTWSADILNVYNSRFQNYVVSAAPQYRMDLSIQKDILSGKGTVKLACTDVFNTQRDKSFSTYDDFTLNFYQKRRTQSFMIMFIYNLSTSQKIKNKSVDSGNDVRGRL